ncbi:MAG: RdgB/HAM1 family non-canonical purine NTP pyrophosphatase [candidate division WOR-3 bacterium]|nr:MAG: RdgB/HAM1 family non-canonical purine NTP pyrophosphatase [candidate division WOR-3 bacterium]
MREEALRPRIILATRNQHKAVEIKKIIGDLVTVQQLNDLLNIDIPECGRTLLENSLAKAEFVYRLRGEPALADDSGLFVEALDGEPGIFSARYGKDDEGRIARLLKNLADKKNRNAAFRAVFVYCFGHGKYKAFEGECVGQISNVPKGEHGFGYDPVFIPKGYKKTFAELGPATKNRISHRARALRKFRKYLEQQM